MPKSPFSMFQDYVNPPKRNTFDLGFTNNLTLNLGGLYPVLVQEVLPGDSFRIKSAFGLRFMPMVFPVQTRMRAHLHYFYVRKRNLWKDFPDFFGNIRQLVEPSYIPKDTSTFRTRSLEDYFGIPTVAHSGVDYSVRYSHADSQGSAPRYFSIAYQSCFSWSTLVGNRRGPTQFKPVLSFSDYPVSSIGLNSESPSFLSCGKSSYVMFRCSPTNYTDIAPYNYDLSASSPLSIDLTMSLKGDSQYLQSIVGRYTDYDTCPVVAVGLLYESYISGNPPSVLSSLDSLRDYFTSCTVSFDSSSGYAVFRMYFSVPRDSEPSFLQSISRVPSGAQVCLSPVYAIRHSVTDTVTPQFSVANDNVLYSYTLSKSTEIRDLPPSHFPYGKASDGKIPINVLPFRAYESIYNSYYRDYRNNPLYDNSGNPVYNKYILHDGDTDPNEVYKLRYRNWQQDFLTTALSSPQQGVAPLVGISSTGQMRFQASEDGKEYTVQAKVADDGDTITGVEVKDNLPNSVARSLVDVATSGISINDFRNVNSLQRWLETNLRRGLRFKDQIEAHFGVSPSYAELDMPEFLGGVSTDVNVNPISQTSDGIGDLPLGWQAGQGSAFSSQEFSVSRYFDEPGYVIGILSVVPQPVYSQVLPKLFLKRENLDYFYPEFGHIGMQPIKYDEITPIESYIFGGSSAVEKTFGYQRAWYDYMSRVDESHGLFRTNLRNYLMNREFSASPELGSEFLVINPNSLSDVFNVQDSDVSDKILGQIVFDIVAKRPIPMYGIPRLE